MTSPKRLIEKRAEKGNYGNLGAALLAATKKEKR